MPKHVLHYDFEDFKQFILEDLTRQGYSPAPGQKPELADLNQINEPDDLEALMTHTIMTVEVIPDGVVATSQLSGSQEPVNPVAQANQVEPKKKKGYIPTSELSPDLAEKRREKQRRADAKVRERQRQAKLAQQQPRQLELAPGLPSTVAAELVEIIPAHEEVASSPFPFQRPSQSQNHNPHNVPSRSFLQQNDQQIQNSHGVRVVGEAL